MPHRGGLLLGLGLVLGGCDEAEPQSGPSATEIAVEAAVVAAPQPTLASSTPPETLTAENAPSNRAAEWPTVRSDLGFEVQFPGPARRDSLAPAGVLAADYYVYEGTDFMFEVAAMQFPVASLGGRSDQALLDVAKVSLHESVSPALEIASKDVEKDAALGHRLRYQSGDLRITKWVFVSGAFAYHVTKQTRANANTSGEEARFFDSLVLTPPKRPGA